MSAAAGQLAENVLHFARALRRAGVPVGPDRALDALRALQVSGVERRDDVYWTLAAVLLGRREHFDLFDQAFQAFWRHRRLAAFAALQTTEQTGEDERVLSNRLAQALNLARSELAPETSGERRESGASEKESLRRRDFEAMTLEELAQAKAMIATMRLPLSAIVTRRLHPDSRGRQADLRATLRASLRGNADAIPLRRRSPVHRHPPLVVLCDISGSMGRYSRMFLHFLHAITNDRDRVHTFLFGTRLTNISRHLRHRDVDIALDAVSNAVADWSGGTRIGATLKEFNLRWSRRVLSQNAVVLLISDGLDRSPGPELSEAMERLHRSCRSLIWLNPLLRFDRFEPLAAGIRLMLPHVDAFLPAHNIQSLGDLARVLIPRHGERRIEWT
jgi:uncharacterized protein with von Willebrand factor type A (vWA) domain